MKITDEEKRLADRFCIDAAQRLLPDGYVVVPQAALAWLFGEEGDFMPPENAKNRPYWWRSEFRRRAQIE